MARVHTCEVCFSDDFKLEEIAAANDFALDAIDAQLDEDSILVMVTHKMPLLSRFDRALVMADGKILSDAPARDILREFVARQVPQKPQAEPPAGTVTSRSIGRQAS